VSQRVIEREVSKYEPEASFNRLHSATISFRPSTSLVQNDKGGPWLISAPSAGVMLNVITTCIIIRCDTQLIERCYSLDRACSRMFDAVGTGLDRKPDTSPLIWLIEIPNSPHIGKTFCMSNSSRSSLVPAAVTDIFLILQHLNTNKLCFRSTYDRSSQRTGGNTPSFFSRTPSVLMRYNG